MSTARDFIECGIEKMENEMRRQRVALRVAQGVITNLMSDSAETRSDVRKIAEGVVSEILSIINS